MSLYNTRNRFNRYVRPTLGSRPIAGLKTAELYSLFDSLMNRHGISAATVTHIKGELRAMLNFALRREYISKNPVTLVEVPSVPNRPPTSLTCDELCPHLAVLEIENPDLELVVTLAATLGLRRSELVALRWSHFDLARGLVHIREGVTKAPGTGYETTATKTGTHGYADFPLHAGLAERLQQRRDAFRKQVSDLGTVDIVDGYLFSSDPAFQTPLHPDSLTGALAKHRLRHPELPYVSLQGLRRYAASDLFGEGEDQTIAAAILRDTPQTTARHYRAANRDRARSAVLGIYERIEIRRNTFDLTSENTPVGPCQIGIESA